MILLIKLLLAHLLADFVFQPDRWVKEKEVKRYRSPKLYFHVILHGALTWLLVWDVDFWLPVIVITVTHYGIDLAKTHLQKPEKKLQWFIADQLLHLLVLAAVWWMWERPSFNHSVPFEQVLVVVTAAVLLITPTSIIIKTVISQWTPDTFYTVSSSLPDAGKFIGYLERLLVLTFILCNHWEAVGFLLAAKSVFRFGNLKESHDRKLTEYVLIGTLLSFGISIMVAILTAWLLTIHPFNGQ